MSDKPTTERNEKCPKCGSEQLLPCPDGSALFQCGTRNTRYHHQTRLCRALERANKAEAQLAEVKRQSEKRRLSLVNFMARNNKLRWLLERALDNSKHCPIGWRNHDYGEIVAELNKITFDER